MRFRIRSRLYRDMQPQLDTEDRVHEMLKRIGFNVKLTD